MRKMPDRIVVTMASAMVAMLLFPTTALADVAIGPTVAAFGLAAVAVIAAVVLSIVAAVAILRFLRKKDDGQRARGQDGGRPVPPDER